VKKYEWDIVPEDADDPRPARHHRPGARRARYGLDQIANDIGMTRQNLERYMRFKGQMKVATDGQKRLRLVSDKG